jgi:hypothetical protein
VLTTQLPRFLPGAFTTLNYASHNKPSRVKFKAFKVIKIDSTSGRVV